MKIDTWNDWKHLKKIKREDDDDDEEKVYQSILSIRTNLFCQSVSRIDVKNITCSTPRVVEYFPFSHE